eukprot:TRINITY_DN252_c0_g2_i1.p1 TRINITY_DN252_c0_g2~~TRINITY_DN252_c0_g2_i1.p1  ORF type:complete len:238 (+),score=44.14 TRINITY_DN252_c0_g2_i1:657-1370(+)
MLSTAESEEDLFVGEGDLIYILAKQGQWYWGCNEEGMTGMFPATVVQVFGDEVVIDEEAVDQEDDILVLKTALKQQARYAALQKRALERSLLANNVLNAFFVKTVLSLAHERSSRRGSIQHTSRSNTSYGSHTSTSSTPSSESTSPMLSPLGSPHFEQTPKFTLSLPAQSSQRGTPGSTGSTNSTNSNTPPEKPAKVKKGTVTTPSEGSNEGTGTEKDKGGGKGKRLSRMLKLNLRT